MTGGTALRTVQGWLRPKAVEARGAEMAVGRTGVRTTSRTTSTANGSMANSSADAGTDGTAAVRRAGLRPDARAVVPAGRGLAVGGALFFLGGMLHPHEDPPGVSLKEHLHV